MRYRSEKEESDEYYHKPLKFFKQDLYLDYEPGRVSPPQKKPAKKQTTKTVQEPTNEQSVDRAEVLRSTKPDCAPRRAPTETDFNQ
jgi:hypothetical protein